MAWIPVMIRRLEELADQRYPARIIALALNREFEVHLSTQAVHQKAYNQGIKLGGRAKPWWGEDKLPPRKKPPWEA